MRNATWGRYQLRSIYVYIYRHIWTGILWPKTAKIRHKISRRRPQDGQDEAQESQEEAQEGHKEAQEGQEEAPRGPRRAS